MKNRFYLVVFLLMFSALKISSQNNTYEYGKLNPDGSQGTGTITVPSSSGSTSRGSGSSSGYFAGPSFEEMGQAAYEQNEADIAVVNDKISNLNNRIGTLVEGENTRVRDRFGSNNRIQNEKEPIANIGNSRVPIYKNPSELIVNTQTEEPSTQLIDYTYAIENLKEISSEPLTIAELKRLYEKNPKAVKVYQDRVSELEKIINDAEASIGFIPYRKTLDKFDDAGNFANIQEAKAKEREEAKIKEAKENLKSAHRHYRGLIYSE